VAEPPPFDPYAILHTLDRNRVTYIVIGAFARVIQGADEITDGVDITPSLRPQNLPRLQAALDELSAQQADGKKPTIDERTLASTPVFELETEHGELKVVPEPAGTQGYDDLRRAATREPLGEGLRPDVASLGDLARMLSALGREDDLPRIHALRRLAELELGRGIDL
jgi:hypothetical protein